MNKKYANSLLLWIFLGAVAGILCGSIFGSSMTMVGWIGDMFLDLLKMLILPLIMAAVISGICSIGDVSRVGRVGGLTVLYYTCTTAISVLLGLVLVNIIAPGSNTEKMSVELPAQIAERESSSALDIITQMVSPNLINAANEMQLLPLIVFFVLFGIALLSLKSESKAPLVNFFASLNAVMMKLVIWVMYLAPIGIFALIANRIAEAGGGIAFLQELKLVGWYCFTVILGLGIHFFILMGIMLTLSRHGWSYLRSLLRALLTAFGTASSSATLPITMECAQEAGVDRRATQFVLPLGVTLNMDGTALYEAVAVMFIAQMLQIPLGVNEQIIIFLTATLAAVGAAGIPQAGLVTMLIVLAAVDLPAEGIGLLLAVDWFLDRFRTTVNVWGDSVGAAVIERFLPVPQQDTTQD